MKKGMRRTIRAVGLASLVFAICTPLVGQPGRAEAGEWATGDVFVGVSTGSYKVYSNSGALKETISDGLGGFTTGCALDTNFDLYTTNFSANRVIKYAGAHPHSILQNILTNGPTPGVDASNESIVFDAAGNFYVGHADGNHRIHKYDPAGNLLATFSVAVEARGTDWIDLAANQTTMFYTSEGRHVKRFDVGTNTQLADFAVLGIPGSGIAFALRLLPPGDGSGLLVADNGNIKRLNNAGAVVQTYDFAGEDTWFSLNLDPNGTSFWAGNYGSANFYRFNIASGAVELGPINTGTGTQLFGLCLKGEPTAAVPAVTIATVAGTGVAGFSGDGGLATNAKLNFPRGVAAGASFYIADRHNHRVRRVDNAGNITTVAGNGMAGFSGDRGAATSARLNLPSGVALGPGGSLYIADFNNHRIRKVAPGSDGVVNGGPDETITTVAGNGIFGSAGDGGAATAANLWNPKGVAVFGTNVYIADEMNQKIRRVDLAAVPPSISTVAGTGVATGTGSLPAPLGDGGSATNATLSGPTGVAVNLATGDLYIADEDNNRVRKVAPGSDGVVNTGPGETITTVVAVGLNGPIGVAVGSLFIAEKKGHRVLKVDLATLAITTFAGTGTPCPDSTSPCGDGGPPTAAQLKSPAGVAVDGNGNVFIADMDDHRIRRVGPPVVVGR